LQDLLRIRYAPHVHSSELDCRNVEQEAGLEIQPIIDRFTVKVEADSECPVIIELDGLDEPESEVATELCHCVAPRSWRVRRRHCDVHTQGDGTITYVR